LKKKEFNLKLANKYVDKRNTILTTQRESFLRRFTSVSGIKNKSAKCRIKREKIKPKSI